MKIFTLHGSILLIFLFAMGCTSAKDGISNDASVVDKRNQVYRGDAGSGPTPEVETERRILFSALLGMTVENPDSANAALTLIAENFNGYVNELGTFQTVIRVKSQYFNSALEEVDKLGKIQRRSIRGLDLTEDYFDYQIRLENAEKTRQRYLVLLDRANTVQEALKVERELERINETIDLLKGRINRIDHLHEYSTITVRLSERKRPGILGYVGLGIYHSVKWLFVRN
ncbi:MAG: DUF4349 domain-containing protein [Saprospirales bacterium]|nr:MAG: DUF4349 domain-containing protein [Saprospirales bacterium]